MAEAVKKQSLFGRIAKYFKEVKSEIKKVIWPTKKQVVNNTAIVILAIAVIGAIIWILDIVFKWVLSFVII